MTTITGASIAPKGQYQGKECYFFGVDRKLNKLKAFGGKKEKTDKKLRDCAKREFSEESLGAFCKEKTIKKKLKDFKGIERIEEKTYSHVTYITPFSNFSKDPIKQFEKKCQKKSLKKKQKEMTEIVAVETGELKTKVSQNNRNVTATNHKVYQLQIGLFLTLQKAHSQNKL